MAMNHKWHVSENAYLVSERVVTAIDKNLSGPRVEVRGTPDSFRVTVGGEPVFAWCGDPMMATFHPMSAAIDEAVAHFKSQWL